MQKLRLVTGPRYSFRRWDNAASCSTFLPIPRYGICMNALDWGMGMKVRPHTNIPMGARLLSLSHNTRINIRSSDSRSCFKPRQLSGRRLWSSLTILLATAQHAQKIYTSPPSVWYVSALPVQAVNRLMHYNDWLLMRKPVMPK